MNKFRILAAFFAIAVNYCAIAQMKKWYSKDQVISFTTSSAPPTVSTNGPTATAPVQTSNGVYEPGGNLLFYLRHNEIYDASHTLVGNFSNTGDWWTHNETVIVPVPGSDQCNRKFMLIRTFNTNCCSGGVDISYIIVTVTRTANNTNVVSASTETTANGSNSANYFSWDSVALAAWVQGGMLSGPTHLFAVGGTGVGGLRIDRYEVTSAGLTNRTVIYSSTSSNIGPSISEADLSVDGSKLAWADYAVSGNYRYHVIGLDANHNFIAGQEMHFNAGSSQVATFMPRGLEFNGSTSKLYVSAGSDGIFAMDMSTFPTAGSVTAITSSGAYGTSQLERASNTRIYASNSTQLRAIDESSNTMDATNFVTYHSTGSSVTTFYTLPDQIDGLDYDNYFTSTGISYNVPTYSATTSAVWTDGSNPFGNAVSPIRIGTNLNIPNGVTVTIRNMTFEFNSGATLTVAGGGTLILDVSTLQAVPCALMWQGIQVANGGTVIMSNASNSSSNSNIFDALVGIQVQGTSSYLTVNGNSKFEKNELHIKLDNVTPTNVSIIKSKFYHLVSLKDQSRGVLDGPFKKGITSILITNCTGSAVVIGDAALNSSNTNTFKRGQYGIYAYLSNVDAYMNTFDNTILTSIYGNANNATTRTFRVTKNTFNTVTNAIKLENKYSSLITSNTFNNGTQHGIIWANNPLCYLTLGDLTNASLGNTFNNNSWTGLYASNNPGAAINIARNTFNGPNYATGISIQENSLVSSGTSYGTLNIQYNTFTGIETGMLMNNIRGYALTPSPIIPPGSISAIRDNTIGINDLVTPTAAGIKVYNSPGLNIQNNSVTSNDSYDWQNRGISIENSPNTLVYGNTLQAGIGLAAGANMLNSDYYCNQLVNNVIGIQLGYHALRINSSTTHGSAGSARPNTFTGTASWGANIELYCSDPAYNKWYFASVTPTISYNNTSCAPAGNIIAGTLGANPCQGARNADLDNTIVSQSILLYPNPATDKFTITSADDMVITKVIVTDLSGRLIKETSVNSTSLEVIDMDDYKGVFIVQIYLENIEEPIFKKVIIE